MRLINPMTPFLLSARPVLASSLQQLPPSLPSTTNTNHLAQPLLESVTQNSTLTRLLNETNQRRLRHAALVLPTFIIGGVLSLFGSGCLLDGRGRGVTIDGGGDGGPDGGPIPDASPDADIDGSTNDAGDSGPVIDDNSTITIPATDISLPNNRIFIRWDPAATLPPGRSIAGYEICYTTTGTTSIDDSTECPQSNTVTSPFGAINITNPSSTYHVKVRALYDDGSRSMGSALRMVNTDSSLLARYTFNEGSGMTASDSSGADNNGTLTNFDIASAWVPGFIGGALNFDGTNDFVELGDTLNFDSTTPYTISAWTNRQSVGSDHTIFARADYTDPALQRGYWFGFSSSDTLDLFFVSDSSTGNRIRIDSTTVFDTPSAPHHVAVTYDGSTMAAGARLFVDGTEETSTVVTDALTGTTLNSASARIGGSIDPSGMPLASLYSFDGVLDDLVIYNRALTAREIVNETCAREALAGSDPLPSICN